MRLLSTGGLVLLGQNHSYNTHQRSAALWRKYGVGLSLKL